uniref:Synaptotagmin like 1 n=1 Tax=Nothoprocta perdicaria TaxID=30464 RepID=A0A8C6Z3D9_NOTPE
FPQREPRAGWRLRASPGWRPARCRPPRAAALLDLSFLTLAERRAIAEVLRRDAQLRRRDEGRVRRLRKSVSDPARLKSLTGDWFCDVRARRHQQPLGSELVRASIRRRRPRGTQGTGTGTAGGGCGAGSAQGPLSASPPACLPDQPCDVSPPAAALEVTPLSQSLREPDIPPGQQDIPLQPGNSGQGGGQCHGAPGTPRARQTSPSRVSPQDVPGSQLSASSSVSSLSSSTVRDTGDGMGRAAARGGPDAVLPPPQLSSSLVSLYSEGELGRVAVRGGVQVALRYEPAAKELHVHVLRLPRWHRWHPRAAAALGAPRLPLHPLLSSVGLQTDLQGRTLNLSVWHHDSLGRNLFLGEVEIALGAWDWANTRPEWFDLQPRTPVSPGDLASHGHLNLALKFIPAGSEGAGLPPTGELHIWVKDARSLAPLRRGTVDAFVQCYVLPDDSKASRQKTRVVKRSLNPLFNHTMVYDGFQAKDLAEACAEVTLWHREAFAKRPLGGIRLSLGTGEGSGTRGLFIPLSVLARGRPLRGHRDIPSVGTACGRVLGAAKR